MKLTLGPVLFNWSTSAWSDFYARIADEAPIDRVIVGEAVCSKRSPFRIDASADVIERLSRGGYLVSFRVRGRSESPGALAAFSVVRHYQNRPHDETARLEWAAAGPEGEFQEVVLPVRNDLEPVRLEARVLGIGRGELEVDQISIYPDLGGDLAAKRMEIEKVLAETGRGILDARAARP